MKKRDVVEQILQQQEYTYLPTYDYSTKPTTTSLLNDFSKNKIEKAAQTNSRICILWNKPKVQTKTKEKKRLNFKDIIGSALVGAFYGGMIGAILRFDPIIFAGIGGGIMVIAYIRVSIEDL